MASEATTANTAINPTRLAFDMITPQLHPDGPLSYILGFLWPTFSRVLNPNAGSRP
jgi:hypothetical protein